MERVTCTKCKCEYDGKYSLYDNNGHTVCPVCHSVKTVLKISDQCENPDYSNCGNCMLGEGFHYKDGKCLPR